MNNHPHPPILTPVQFVKGVGPKIAKLLEKANIFTAEDLLYTIPRRYEDRSKIPSIIDIQPNTTSTIKGRVLHSEIKKTKNGIPIARVMISDGTGKIWLSWFNQPWHIKKLTNYSGEIIAYGTVRESTYELFLEMNNPDWEILDSSETNTDFAQITPIYPLTEGLTNKTMRKIILNALETYAHFISDPLPQSILSKYHLTDLKSAIYNIHHPESIEVANTSRKRIALEEFLYLQLGLTLQRLHLEKEKGVTQIIPNNLLQDIQKHLPFELTNAQKKVIQEIWKDMEKSSPMNRLVQGDVGSGKTMVAFSAMLAAVKNGYQVALMAPTEILAQQHADNLQKRFSDFGFEVGLLLGKMKKKERSTLLDKIACGLLPVIIGTHALIQDTVSFHKLGLAVIDEQHRFGVLQRAKLYEKSSIKPDVLVMTATPIPRTLTMAFYGDLDISIIDELPAGRKPIVTHFKRFSEQRTVFSGVKKLLDEGRQAYFICPLIEESEKLQAKAATELYDLLSEKIFPEKNIGLLHSQMKKEEKEEIMEQFRRHDLDILVSTVVIEVGVDVPNASIMVIMDANRFGLSQLHQLRGRVGRGEHQSFCVLMADVNYGESRDRLDIMVQTNDGFKIAEEDLRIRGPGEIMGVRQSGEIEFRVADLVQDADMVEVCKKLLSEILGNDIQESKQKFPDIYSKLDRKKLRLNYATIS